MKKSKYIAICFVLTLLACEEKEYELTWTEKQEVDSLYKESLPELNGMFDSICTSKQDSLVSFYYDSILNIRIQELTNK